jgi:metal-sulfur cluster biosynthetic enzyme
MERCQVSPSRDEVLEALRGVPEPCSIAMRAPVDICEMGLVDDVRIEAGAVRVELVLTDPSCAHFASMRRYITDLLLQLDGVESVEVVMSTTKLWTSERMRRRRVPT